MAATRGATEAAALLLGVPVLEPRITICGRSRAALGLHEDAARSAAQAVYSARFSKSGELIALSMGDGVVEVHNVKTGVLVAKHQGEGFQPCTCLRWAPRQQKNIIITANCEGFIEEWDVDLNRRVDQVREPNNNAIYALDNTDNGHYLASAGKDKIIRIYDVANIDSGPINLLEVSGESTHLISVEAHSNRIYSLKFPHADDNLLLSGGWDNTVQIWDLRTKKAVRHLSGCHIAGDSVDVYDKTILTGSWTKGKSLALWDLGTGNKIKDIDWSPGFTGLSRLYTAQFSKMDRGSHCIAGGSDNKEARIFNVESGQVVGRIPTGKGPTGHEAIVYCSHFSLTAPEVAVSTSDGRVLIVPYLTPTRARAA